MYIYFCYLQDIALPKSKYEEDVLINNHTTVWGSWWKDHQWGYKCCKQTIKNSYCTGLAGIEAAEASADLMKANMARKEAAEGMLTKIILAYICALQGQLHNNLCVI
jgi:pre-mRNA-processing factor SLU7